MRMKFLFLLFWFTHSNLYNYQLWHQWFRFISRHFTNTGTTFPTVAQNTVGDAHTHTHARRRSVWYSNSLDYLNLCDIFTTENETVASARTLPASAVLSGGRCHLRRQTNTHAQRQLHCVRARSQNAHGALIRICCGCADADGARTARTSRPSNHPQSALAALRQPAVARDGRKFASQIWRKVVPGVPFHDRNRIIHSPQQTEIAFGAGGHHWA